MEYNDLNPDVGRSRQRVGGQGPTYVRVDMTYSRCRALEPDAAADPQPQGLVASIERSHGPGVTDVVEIVKCEPRWERSEISAFPDSFTP